MIFDCKNRHFFKPLRISILNLTPTIGISSFDLSFNEFLHAQFALKCSRGRKKKKKRFMNPLLAVELNNEAHLGTPNICCLTGLNCNMNQDLHAHILEIPMNTW